MIVNTNIIASSDQDEFKGVHWALLSFGNTRLVAQRFDLRRGLDAAVGDDLLEHPEPRFDALHVLRILSALLGREVALRPSICFSLTRSHILNGAMPIAARGIRTQIQLRG